jgi:hypothetical protein
MWAAHLESALGSSQTGLPFQLAASGESRTARSGLVRARGHRRFVQRGLRATAAGPQRVNHGFFRRLPRTGECTGATLDSGATRIVEDKREAHITCVTREGLLSSSKKRIIIQRSIAGARPGTFRSPAADPFTALEKPELPAIARS